MLYLVWGFITAGSASLKAQSATAAANRAAAQPIKPITRLLRIILVKNMGMENYGE
jgi:hypothetical protein